MMQLQTLVAALNQNGDTLPEKMKLEGEALVVNQCDSVARREIKNNNCHIIWYDMNDRGVGLNRNTSLMRAEGEIVLFSDEDIEYVEGYTDLIARAFADNPEADMLLFNVEVEESRRTYYIQSRHRVHRWNCGRYPSYSFACRLERLRALNITFNLLFGGGCRYSNGEDSLFIWECIKKGMVVYALPQTIGREIPRVSTWFHGYNEKFFMDRGVLYRFMYGIMAVPMSVRFVLKMRSRLTGEISPREALRLMKKGIDSAPL